MKLIVSILTFFLVANLVGIGDDKSDVKQVVAEIDQNTKWVPEVLVDPKTKVVFYLESDRRHVSAISPEGKILWCVEIVPPREKVLQDGAGPLGIGMFRFAASNEHVDSQDKGDECLKISVFGVGFGGTVGYINKATGKRVGHWETS